LFQELKIKLKEKFTLAKEIGNEPYITDHININISLKVKNSNNKEAHLFTYNTHFNTEDHFDHNILSEYNLLEKHKI